MKFIDKVKLNVKAGKGGDGMIAFRREAHVDRGGPSGGDGGNGGNIYFVGDTGKNTLLHLYLQKHIIGFDGVKGGRKNLYGANGEDTFIKVPVGTLVYEGDSIIADVIDENQYLIAKGGKGGRGNAKFKTDRNKAPRLNELGMPGENKNLTLVLKVLADVGFVGLPNAGKSTLLSVISNAKPKIADYAFTTLVPQLGMVDAGDNSFVVADLPGLIQGASQGKGLGLNFLQHIERCKLIAHVIDFGTPNINVIENYERIIFELNQFDNNLTKREEIIIANKLDLEDFEANFKKFKAKYPDKKVFKTSGLLQTDLHKLKLEIGKMLVEINKPLASAETAKEVEFTYDPDFEIVKNYEGDYDIFGSKVEYWYNRIPLTTDDNWRRFNSILKKMGIWNELQKMGVKENDTIRIFSHEFSWSYNDRLD